MVCRRSVGGAITTGATNTTPEELASELRTYDMKVHHAQMQMVTEFTTKMKRMGVPFFGTKSDLVRKSKKEDSKADGSTTPTYEPGDEKAKIDEDELIKLQKKIIGILEDLCGD
jgi:hypothetical protein